MIHKKIIILTFLVLLSNTPLYAMDRLKTLCKQECSTNNLYTKQIITQNSQEVVYDILKPIVKSNSISLFSYKNPKTDVINFVKVNGFLFITRYENNKKITFYSKNKIEDSQVIKEKDLVYESYVILFDSLNKNN